MRFTRSFYALLCAVCLVVSTAVAQPTGGASAPADAEATGAGSEALQGLLDVLKDDAARTDLIAELEAALASEDADPLAPPPPSETLARRLADLTSGVAEETFSTVSRMWRDFRGIGGLFSGLSEERQQRIAEGWLPLILTIVSTVAILWVLTRLVGRWRQRSGAPSHGGLPGRLLAVVVNAVSDIALLALAYAAGTTLAFTFFGTDGQVGIEPALYLNAFLVAGAVRIVLRAFVLPDRPEQTLSPLSQPLQKMIYRRAGALNFLLVYGITAAVPIANSWLSFAVGRSIRITVVTVAAILALLAIRALARLVQAEAKANARAQIAAAAAEASEEEQMVDALSEASLNVAVSLWNRVWPWLAAAYVLGVYVISITRPRMMVEVIGLTTVKTIGVILLVTFAISLARQAKTAQLPLPSGVATHLPELQTRLQGLVPMLSRLAAILLAVMALALLADAWGVLDVGGWLSGEAGAAFLSRVLSAFLILGLVLLVWVVVASWVDHRLAMELDGVNVTARGRTLLSLFRNAFTVAIFIFGTMIALSQLGIDIAPLLAGAGVIGLAIGFGSQKLVQDIITGVFIQLENAINEGDVVTVGGITGAVEKLTIRSVSLRSIEGGYHIVPFSSVDTVSNFMRKFSFHVEVAGIAYKESVSAAKDAMFEAFKRLKSDPEHSAVILDDLEMHGVVALADSSVNLRARIKTLPGKQWALGRAYTELVKEVFDERNIEIPFPHRQLMIAKEDAPALVAPPPGPEATS